MGEMAFIRKWIIRKEAVLLTVIPFSGYLIAFSFEAGYCSYCGIPIRFIDLNFITVVIASAVAALCIYPFYLYIHFALALKKEKHVIWRVLSSMLLCLLPFVFWLVYSDGSTEARRFFWIAAGLIALYYFVLPLFSRQTWGGGYWLEVKKMLYTKAAHEEPRPRSGKDKLFEFIHSALIVAVPLVICFAIGSSYAQTETDFWVLENSQDTILLRKYGDYMVLKKYNVKTREIETGVQVMRFADNGGVSLRQVNVGKLKKISIAQ